MNVPRYCKSHLGRVAIISSLMVLFLSSPIAIGHSRAQDDPEDFPLYIPLVLQNHDSNLTWLESSSVDLTPRPSSSPLAIIDSQGRLHLLWDTLSSPRFIYHTMQSGSGWTSPAPVAPSNGTSYILNEPYIGENGVIHLVWRNWLGSGIAKPHRLLYSSFNGTHWTPEEEVARFDNNYSLRALIHSGQQGEVHVEIIWSLIATHVYHTTRSQSGWSIPVEVKPVHTTSLIWVDMQGGIHFYGDDYSGKVHYSYWKNDAFLVTDRTMEGRVYSRSSQMDGFNNLHLFWSGQVPVPGGQVNGLYHQCLEDNRIFGPQEVPSGSLAISGSVPRASDRVTQIGLAWKEAQSGKVRLGIWQGCTSFGIRTIPFPDGLNLELTSLAMSANPGKVCALARKLYTNEHIVSCANVMR
jgi:hypothetical protein